MDKGERKKGFGKHDRYTPDGAGAKPAKGPKMERELEAVEHHTGGAHNFQAEYGRCDMPGAPGGSRSLQGE